MPTVPSLEFVSQDDGKRWITRLWVKRGREPPFPCPTGTAKLKMLTSDLADAIGIEAFGATFDPGSALSRAKIRTVAELGRRLFEALIREEDRPAFLDGLRNATPLLPAVDPTRGVVLTYEQALRIWWPFLYTEELPSSEPVDMDAFLGSEFMFVACPETSATGEDRHERDDRLTRRLVGGKGPQVGHVWDNNLLKPSIPVNELWFDGVPNIVREELDPPLDADPQRHGEMMDRLHEFVTRGHDGLQFDCHGHPHGSFPWVVDLGVRNDFRARHDGLRLWKFVGNPSVVAVLNSCNAGRGQLAEVEESLAEALTASGISGLIAPMSKMPVVLLMDTSRVLYAEMMGGEPLLAAFDAAQSSLLKVGNPAAHAFVLHATGYDFVAAVRFEQIGERDQVTA